MVSISGFRSFTLKEGKEVKYNHKLYQIEDANNAEILNVFERPGIPFFREAKAKRTDLCPVWGCMSKRLKNDRYCSKHRKQYKKANNPEAYHYDLLKGNAKRRKVNFKLTLEEFKKFCKKTGYLNGKGRNKNKLSIDRIDPLKGYELSNLQVLTVSENSKKGQEDKKILRKRLKKV